MWIGNMALIVLSFVLGWASYSRKGFGNDSLNSGPQDHKTSKSADQLRQTGFARRLFADP